MRRIAERRIDGVLHVGLIALLIASTMNGLSFEWAVAGADLTIRPDQVVLIFVMPVLAVAWILGRFGLHLMAFEGVVLGFLLSNIAASLLFSPSRSASLKGAVLLVGYGAMYFVVRQILTNRTEWLPGATTWAFCLGIAQAAYCLIAVVLYSFGYAIGGLQIGHLTEGSVAIKGTFWEANLLGSYLALIALFLTVRYVLRTERRGGRTELAGLFITCLALPLTVTRAAGVALALGGLAIAVLVWVFRREILEWRARTGRVVLALATVLLLTVTLMDYIVSTLSVYPNLLLERWIPISSSAIGREELLIEGDGPWGKRPTIRRDARVVEGGVTRSSRSSVEGRVDAWALALERWQERPVLGHGTLAGEREVQEGWWYSSLVQALYDTGLVGFFGLLWIHVGGVVLPARAWLRTRHRPMSVNLVGFGAGNAVLGFSSQFSNFLFVGFPWVFLGMSMAAVQAAARSGETARDSPDPVPSGR